MDRTQFTFYSSVYEAISKIKKKADRADAYDAVCAYALYGEEPNIDALSDAAAIVFISCKPNLDASRRKAMSGKSGGSKPKANRKQTQANGKQTESKKEKEKEKEIEIENECYNPIVPFDEFWKAYPKKVGKGDAEKAFGKVKKADIPKLVPAVERQKQSKQWLTEGGRFIPNPATWLNQKRWEDELETDQPVKAQPTPNAEYYDRIRWLMEEMDE